jgi:hypothetical protein
MPAKLLMEVIVYSSLLAEDVLALLYDLLIHNVSAISMGEQAGSRSRFRPRTTGTSQWQERRCHASAYNDNGVLVVRSLCNSISISTVRMSI